jgi:hypothetical protein
MILSSKKLYIKLIRIKKLCRQALCYEWLVSSGFLKNVSRKKPLNDLLWVQKTAHEYRGAEWCISCSSVADPDDNFLDLLVKSSGSGSRNRILS